MAVPFRRDRFYSLGMKALQRQSGFALIEAAILLVIIGLLLGALLKGPGLLANASVKTLAQDFREIPIYIYNYQDRFHALPGDDAEAANNVPGATPATTPVSGQRGDRVIDGGWNSTTNTDESCLFWQHVRLAGIVPGQPKVDCAANSDYWPRNAVGGQVGVQSRSGFTRITTLATGTHVTCSQDIPGKYVRQLDALLDDGNTAGGSMQAVPSSAADGAAATTNSIADTLLYTVCMGF